MGSQRCTKKTGNFTIKARSVINPKGTAIGEMAPPRFLCEIKSIPFNRKVKIIKNRGREAEIVYKIIDLVAFTRSI